MAILMGDRSGIRACRLDPANEYRKLFMNYFSLKLADHPFTEQKHLNAHALFLGEQIHLLKLENCQLLATDPLMLATDSQGCAVLLPYGAVVLFGLTPEAETAFLAALAPLIYGAFPLPETEKAELYLDRTGRERVKDGKFFFE